MEKVTGVLRGPNLSIHSYTIEKSKEKVKIENKKIATYVLIINTKVTTE